MSDTPRTDAFHNALSQSAGLWYLARWKETLAFARTLEHELAEARAEIARLRADADQNDAELGWALADRARLWETLQSHIGVASQLMHAEREVARLRAKYKIAFTALTSLRDSPVAVEALQACIDYKNSEPAGSETKP